MAGGGGVWEYPLFKYSCHFCFVYIHPNKVLFSLRPTARHFKCHTFCHILALHKVSLTSVSHNVGTLFKVMNSHTKRSKLNQLHFIC